MKQHLLALLLVLPLLGLGQIDLKQDLERYMAGTRELDYAIIADHMHPYVLDMMGGSKEVAIEALEKTFEAANMMVRTPKMDITGKPFLVESGTSQYGVVPYEAALQIKVTADSTGETTELMLGIFKMQNGEENVRLNDETGYIEVDLLDKYMYVFWEEGYEHWAFMEMKPNMSLILNEIMPTEVQSKIAAHVGE